MLFYACINNSNIVGYNILKLAKLKASELKKKYPKEKITVEWSSWYEGTKSKDNYHILEINS